MSSKSSGYRHNAKMHMAAAAKAMASAPGLSEAEKLARLQGAANHLATAFSQVSMAIATHGEKPVPALPVDMDKASADIMAGIEKMLEEGA